MLQEIFSIIAPIFLCAAIGFLWAKRGESFDNDFVGKLVMNIAAPCLIFSTMTRLHVSTEALSTIGLATLLAIFLIGLMGFITTKVWGLDDKTYLPSMIFSNTGNMGLPLCLYAFGDEGLAFSMVIFVCSIAIHLSAGIMYVSGRSNLEQVLNAPILYAVVLALLINIGGLPLPRWLFNTTELLGDMAIPLMLLVLGISLANLKINTLKEACKLSLARLILCFSCALLVVNLVPLPKVAQGVLILQLSMPVAVFNYLIARQFKRGDVEVASFVVVSTAFSFATLPLLLWYVLGSFSGT